jgi:hypothetical protein
MVLLGRCPSGRLPGLLSRFTGPQHTICIDHIHLPGNWVSLLLLLALRLPRCFSSQTRLGTHTCSAAERRFPLFVYACVYCLHVPLLSTAYCARTASCRRALCMSALGGCFGQGVSKPDPAAPCDSVSTPHTQLGLLSSSRRCRCQCSTGSAMQCFGRVCGCGECREARTGCSRTGRMPGVTDTLGFVVCCVGAPGPHVLNVRHTLVCAAGAGAAPALACQHACSLSAALGGCSSPLVAVAQPSCGLSASGHSLGASCPTAAWQELHVCQPGFCQCLPVESRHPGVLCCVGCCCCCCAVCCSPHALGTLGNLLQCCVLLIEGGGVVHSSA